MSKNRKIDNKIKNCDIMLTCGKALCKVDDFLYSAKKGCFDYRIHLGKKDRNNLEIIENILIAQEMNNRRLNIYVDIPTTRLRVGICANANINEKISLKKMK